VLNVLTTLFGCALLLRALRRGVVSGRAWNLLLALPWVVGCYFVLTSQNLGTRFGCFLYMMGIPMLAGTIHWLWCLGGRARLASSLPALVAFLLLVNSISLVGTTRSRQWYVSYVADGRLRQSFLELLRSVGDDYERIYVLNDFVGAFGGGYLQAFSGSASPVTVLNGVDPPPSDGSRIEVAFARRDDGAIEIAVDLSEDLRVRFWGAHRLQKALRQGERVVSRSGEIHYWIPDGAPHDERHLRMLLATTSSCAIVYYDTDTGRFTLFDPEVSSKSPVEDVRTPNPAPLPARL